MEKVGRSGIRGSLAGRLLIVGLAAGVALTASPCPCGDVLVVRAAGVFGADQLCSGRGQ